jgi:uncharacterized protein YbjT (DUF2867 family)
VIVVTGATGNIGAELVDVLAGAGTPVRAVSRGGATVDRGRVEQVVGDLNEPASLAPAFRGARGVFLLPGYRDMPGVLAVARRAGVERVVLLSGASAASGDTSNAVSRYMIESEEAVRGSGLPWTILRPSAFMSNTLRWLPQLEAGDVVRLPFAHTRAAVVDPRDIARVAALALTEAGHAGQVYLPTGPESLSPEDQVRIVGRALERDLRFEAQSNEDARSEMSAAMPVEYVDAFFDFYVKGTLDESVVRSTVLDVTGHPPRTLERWAVAHAALFRERG